MTAPEPQTEEGESIPATEEVEFIDENKGTEEPGPDKPLGETSAEQ